jgi:hypothetical protein
VVQVHDAQSWENEHKIFWRLLELFGSEKEGFREKLLVLI